MDITVTEIMEIADLHAHAKITDGTPAELLPRNLLQCRMQQIVSHVFGQDCELTAARLEIESLQAQAQQCGAGAGCCAQAARIEELEAQLEAVGAGGAGRLAPDVSIINEGDMPAAQALDLVRIFWQQHTQADALSMTMAELHVDAERVIRAALAAPAQAEAPAHAARAAQALPEVRAALITAAPQPAAQMQDALKQVCAIAVSATKTNSRDIADWREDIDRIAAIAAQKGNHD